MSIVISALARLGFYWRLWTGRRRLPAGRSTASSAPTGPAVDDSYLPTTSSAIDPARLGRSDDAERLAAEQSPEAVADDLGLPVNADVAAVVTTIGRAERLTGDLRFTAPLHIKGRVEGRLLVMEHGVVVARHAVVQADILAEVVTVRGAVKGNVTAVRRVRIACSGSVEGDVAAPEVVIEDGACLTGRVDPHRVATTIAVARHRLSKAGGQPGPAP